MKTVKSLLIFIMSILFCKPGLAQNKFVSDLDLYRQAISDKHINPFTKITKEYFNQRLDALIADEPGLTKEQVIAELLKINALIADEHTIIFPNADFYLPFQFKLFDEGVAITVTDSMNERYLLHRVLSVNNKLVDEILAALKALIKEDNPSYSKFFEAYYFNNTAVLQGLGIIKDLSGIEFKLLSPQGDTVTTTVHAIKKEVIASWKYAEPYKQLLAYKQNSNYWFDYNETNKILYFNYQHCAEIKDESFAAFNKKLFQFIDEKKPVKLILDLRFNSGGNSSVLKPFIKSINDSYLNTKDGFFVLIGRVVMSSSIMNAVELRKTTNATFLGEATGGNINHFGELKDFNLPNLNVRVTYSTKYWENWKNKEGPLVPDISVSNSFSDFIKAKDKAIEKILEL